MHRLKKNIMENKILDIMSISFKNDYVRSNFLWLFKVAENNQQQ